jgi:hypothetical protein
MKYEEYIEKRKELTQEVAKKRKEYAEAKTNLRKLEKLFAYQIAKQYDNMAIVKKMKEIVPEYKSNNSVYEVLDKE